MRLRRTRHLAQGGFVGAALDPLSIATSSTGLSPSAARFLNDLEGTNGKCLCHIAATADLPLRLTNDLVVELLAHGWVRLEVPTDAEAEGQARLSEIETSVKALDLPGRLSVWRAYLRQFEWSKESVHHLVVLDREGKRELARYRRRR